MPSPFTFWTSPTITVIDTWLGGPCTLNFYEVVVKMLDLLLEAEQGFLKRQLNCDTQVLGLAREEGVRHLHNLEYQIGGPSILPFIGCV
jgi:hypothetical protein